MNILEFGRKKGFWMIDKIKHGVIKNELTLMTMINSASLEKQAKYQQEKLKKLLEHASNTTEFYAKFKDNSIENFPVISKAMIKGNYQTFLSSDFDKNELYKMTTSGSTGTPFISYQNLRKKKSTYTEVLYYNGKIGYEIGKKIIYLRAVVKENKKSKIQQFAQNIYLINCYDLSDEGIENILKKIIRLTRFSGAMLMGYASTFDALSNYLHRKGDNLVKKCKIYGVVSGSEMLFDNTRDTIEKAFECKCVSRYANEENGFLGQDMELSNNFVTNPAHFYYEIMKMDSNELADQDEVGRIVVTDLNNLAMPMIRYDTGDIGRLKIIQSEGHMCYVITDFGGRKTDVIYNCYGHRIGPHSLGNMIKKYYEIQQYQLIQKDKNVYEFKINTLNSDREQELYKDLLTFVGEDAHLNIVHVDDIPIMASGKHQFIVNEMK